MRRSRRKLERLRTQIGCARNIGDAGLAYPVGLAVRQKKESGRKSRHRRENQGHRLFDHCVAQSPRGRAH